MQHDHANFSVDSAQRSSQVVGERRMTSSSKRGCRGSLGIPPCMPPCYSQPIFPIRILFPCSLIPSSVLRNYLIPSPSIPRSLTPLPSIDSSHVCYAIPPYPSIRSRESMRAYFEHEARSKCSQASSSMEVMLENDPDLPDSDFTVARTTCPLLSCTLISGRSLHVSRSVSISGAS